MSCAAGRHLPAGFRALGFVVHEAADALVLGAPEECSDAASRSRRCASGLMSSLGSAQVSDTILTHATRLRVGEFRCRFARIRASLATLDSRPLGDHVMSPPCT
jgi:hypothetical protein